MTLDDGVNPGGKNDRTFPPQLYPVRDTEYRLRSQPVRDIFPRKTTHKLPDTPILIREYFPADVTSRVFVGDRCRFFKQFQENVRGGWSVLNRGKAPCVKIAQAADFLFPVVLETHRLKFFQKATEGTAMLRKHLQDRLMHDELFVGPHEIVSAMRAPHQTAASPRKRLLNA